MEEPQEEHVEVFRAGSAASLREHALVLAARRIPCVEVVVGNDRVLAVPKQYVDLAETELSHYVEENRNWPPKAPRVITLSNGKTAAFYYSLVLVAVFLLDRDRPFELPWKKAGLADAEAILSGEWWRTITSLTLHADLLHLASNLAFGAFFIAFSCHLLGTGVSLLAALMSGVLGTLLNVIVQGAPHLSLGASTSVFGAVGVYVAFLWADRRRQSYGPAYIWSPLLFGAFYLGQFGMTGENTDVVAHGTGFVCGLLIGAFLGRIGSAKLVSSGLQNYCAAVAGLIIVLGWIAALV